MDYVDDMADSSDEEDDKEYKKDKEVDTKVRNYFQQAHGVRSDNAIQALMKQYDRMDGDQINQVYDRKLKEQMLSQVGSD